MLYSKTTGGFYHEQINAGKIPDDAVEITAEYHEELLIGQAEGKVIGADERGYPRLFDKSEPTAEELIRRKNSASRSYLASTDWYVTRFSETGVAIPEEIRAAREAARLSIVE